MTHPLVKQLRFTRSEFMRGIKKVSEEDAQKRLLPMNCLSWNVGHLAWQEQRYFLMFGQGQVLLPKIAEEFAYGAPGTTPKLSYVLKAWKTITQAADPWLDSLTTESLQQFVMHKGKPTQRMFGNLLQRVIYHYWYHTGENLAIRQQLGHSNLPQFVGNIDDQAPYTPEGAGVKKPAKKK
jgi:uncharacterized damage-inducible protein DinB